MSTHFNIDYSGWSDEASPIKKDVKIKTSHNKLVSQKQNALARGEWGRKNPDKQRKIGIKGGEAVNTPELKQKMSKIGKQYGPENAVKYIPIETKKRNGKKYGKQNLVSDIVCETCGRKTNKGNYAQFHGKKCREKDIINFIQLLPDKFTKSIARDIAKENRIKGWEKWNIFHDLCIYTKCIVKVDKPNQYNPCWYGKNKREINKVYKSIK
jgi:hypothetical protein